MLLSIFSVASAVVKFYMWIISFDSSTLRRREAL